jgi:hypothetical protein
MFVPVVSAVWVAGHIALWGVRRLAVKGKVSTSAAEGEAQPWPPALRIALLGTGAASSVGLLQLVASVVLGKRYPFPGALWTVTMIIWIAHGACFAGLLLRRQWSRWAAAMLSLGWALLLAWRILEHVLRGYRIHSAEFLIAIGLLALFAILGYRILASKRTETFFGS